MKSRTWGYWCWGERKMLSKKSGQSESRISLILHRRLTPALSTAIKLAKAAESMGHNIPVDAWIHNERTSHPAFEPKKR